jgi:hypothetical protein
MEIDRVPLFGAYKISDGIPEKNHGKRYYR